MAELTGGDEPTGEDKQTGGNSNRTPLRVKSKNRRKARDLYPGLYVLQTESKDDFDKLLADANQDIGPRDFIERQHVRDVVCYIWDIMRYRRIINGLINNELRSAVAQIVRPMLGRPGNLVRFCDNYLAAEDLAFEWMIFQETKRRVRSLLKEAGLDESAIEAAAFRKVADDLEQVQRMLRSAEAGRDGALRSIAKYRKSLGDKVRRYSDRTLAVEEMPRLPN
jgi:hypothetical protein